MNIENSFEYVFRGLLTEVRSITVSYGHSWEQFEQNPSSFDSRISLKVKENPYWVKTFSISTHGISQLLESAKKNIEENMNELGSMLIHFIQQWETITMEYKKFLHNEYTFQELVDNGLIKLNWTKKTYSIPYHDVIKYGPDYNPYVEHRIDKSKIPEIPEDDREFTEEDFANGCRGFLERLVKSLEDFIIFLKHKSNVTNLEKNEPKKMVQSSSATTLSIQVKREIKGIISKNNIENAFDRLMEIFDGHAKENDLIQLIRRYNKNKQDRHKDILANENLQREENKIVDALLEFIK